MKELHDTLEYNLFLICLLISVFFLFSCTQPIHLKSSVHDVDITAHLYKTSGEGPFPAVMVLHTIAGMQPHVLKFSSALSRKGYVTVAVDYFSGREKLPYNMLDYYRHIKDTYNYLKALPIIDPKRIGMVGFSLGPRKAFKFARNSNEPIQGIVSYYVGRLRYVPSGLRE